MQLSNNATRFAWLAFFVVGACNAAASTQELIHEGPSLFDEPTAYFTSFGSSSGTLKIHCFSVQHVVDIKYERLDFFRHDRLMSGAHRLVARHAGGQLYRFVVEPDPQFQCVGSGPDFQSSTGVP